MRSFLWNTKNRMNRIKYLSQKGNVCLLFNIGVCICVCTYGHYVCTHTHTHTHTHTYTSGPFFILQITGTKIYQLVSEDYIIVQ